MNGTEDDKGKSLPWWEHGVHEWQENSDELFAQNFHLYAAVNKKGQNFFQSIEGHIVNAQNRLGKEVQSNNRIRYKMLRMRVAVEEYLEGNEKIDLKNFSLECHYSNHLDHRNQQAL